MQCYQNKTNHNGKFVQLHFLVFLHKLLVFLAQLHQTTFETFGVVQGESRKLEYPVSSGKKFYENIVYQPFNLPPQLKRHCLSIIKCYEGEWQDALKPGIMLLPCSRHINNIYNSNFPFILAPKCYEIFARTKFMALILIQSWVAPNGQWSQHVESTEYGQNKVELEKCSSVYVNYIAPTTLKTLQTYVKSHLSTNWSIMLSHSLHTSSKE